MGLQEAEELLIEQGPRIWQRFCRLVSEVTNMASRRASFMSRLKDGSAELRCSFFSKSRVV